MLCNGRQRYGKYQRSCAEDHRQAGTISRETPGKAGGQPGFDAGCAALLHDFSLLQLLRLQIAGATFFTPGYKCLL
jgi:hypothetical protein